MLVGRNDAWALMALASGVAAANPWLAGDPAALAAAVLVPALGAASLTRKTTEGWLNRVDTAKREDFILKSDETFGDFALSQRNGIRLGYTRDQGLPVDIADMFMGRHTAIIGQSGVGKTTLGEYILWQQITRGGGFIFIDAKIDADTRDRLAYMMEITGRADDLYVLNVDNPANSHSYNPGLSGDADEIASRFLNLLPSSENNPGSDFYRQSANHALTVIAGALKAGNKRYHFNDLAILMQSARAIQELERIVPLGSSERMALQVFLDQFRKKQGKEIQIDTDRLKTVLGGMSGRIASFAQGKFGKVFNTYTPEIDLTEIIRGNKCLYVMLPTMGKDTAALNLGKMILSDLRTAVYNIQNLRKADRPNPPFIVFADEMGSYVMPGIARLFEQARSANICMIPAFQTFANLRSVSPDFEDIIIGNTWNKVFFKFASKSSPETAAEIIGQHTTYIKSMSTSENEGASASNTRATPQGSASKGGGLSESFRETEDYRVKPDHLKSLGMGEAVVLSGSRMFHVRTPMLNIPGKLPEFRAIHRKVEMPVTEQGLDYTERYKEFLMGTEEVTGAYNDDPAFNLGREQTVV